MHRPSGPGAPAGPPTCCPLSVRTSPSKSLQISSWRWSSRCSAICFHRSVCTVVMSWKSPGGGNHWHFRGGLSPTHAWHTTVPKALRPSGVGARGYRSPQHGPTRMLQFAHATRRPKGHRRRHPCKQLQRIVSMPSGLGGRAWRSVTWTWSAIISLGNNLLCYELEARISPMSLEPKWRRKALREHYKRTTTRQV